MPVLEADALAWAECVTVHEIEPGDHVVLLGQVEDGEGAADEDAPLMYYRRSWGVWKPAPRETAEPPDPGARGQRPGPALGGRGALARAQ